jgi:hypothetical protein
MIQQESHHPLTRQPTMLHRVEHCEENLRNELVPPPTGHATIYLFPTSDTADGFWRFPTFLRQRSGSRWEIWQSRRAERRGRWGAMNKGPRLGYASLLYLPPDSAMHDRCVTAASFRRSCGSLGHSTTWMASRKMGSLYPNANAGWSSRAVNCGNWKFQNSGGCCPLCL